MHRIRRSQNKHRKQEALNRHERISGNRFALLLTHRWRPFIRNIRMPGIDRWLPRASSSVRVCALTMSHFMAVSFFFFFLHSLIDNDKNRIRWISPGWRTGSEKFLFDVTYRWTKMKLKSRIMRLLKWIWSSEDSNDGLNTKKFKTWKDLLKIRS